MLRDTVLQLFRRLVQLVDEDADFRSNLYALVESARGGAAISIPQDAEPASDCNEQSLSEETANNTPEAHTDFVAVCDDSNGTDKVTGRENEVKDWVQSPSSSPPSDDSLPAIELRCRLKSEATRWAIDRKAAMAAGVNYKIEIAPTDREFFERARNYGDCRLWMLHPEWHMPNDKSDMEKLEACFRVLAEAASLAWVTLNELPYTDYFETAIRSLAEAQSALRVAVARVNDRGDKDQAAAFYWLRGTTFDRQIPISRYMHLADPADPTETSSLSARIETLASEVKKRLAGDRTRRRLYAKMHFLLDQLSHGNGARIENWQALAEAIDDLIATGVAPSNKEIRESLLPVIAGMPVIHDLPKGFSSVLTQLNRHRGAQQRRVTRANKPPIPPEVKQVRALLKRKTVLLIGGLHRNHARRKLERALKLKRLNWISSAEYESVELIRAAVSDPDVTVVLLANRTSNHLFKKVQQFCHEYGKPLVRLPSAYTPGQVAFQILTQCGDRLRCASEALATAKSQLHLGGRSNS